MACLWSGLFSVFCDCHYYSSPFLSLKLFFEILSTGASAHFGATITQSKYRYLFRNTLLSPSGDCCHVSDVNLLFTSGSDARFENLWLRRWKVTKWQNLFSLYQSNAIRCSATCHLLWSKWHKLDLEKVWTGLGKSILFPSPSCNPGVIGVTSTKPTAWYVTHFRAYFCAALAVTTQNSVW